MILDGKRIRNTTLKPKFCQSSLNELHGSAGSADLSPALCFCASSHLRQVLQACRDVKGQFVLSDKLYQHLLQNQKNREFYYRHGHSLRLSEDLLTIIVDSMTRPSDVFPLGPIDDLPKGPRKSSTKHMTLTACIFFDIHGQSVLLNPKP